MSYSLNAHSNQSHFDIIIADNSHHGLQIIYFESTLYQLDKKAKDEQNYCYEIFCYNPQQVALNTLIAKSAALIFYDNCDKPHYQHGIITHACDTQQQYYTARLTLQSPLYPLSCNIQHRVYHQVTLEQLIIQILQQSASLSLDYQILLHEKYPLREYVVQYQENDYAFLHRQCAYYGVFFTFMQTPDRAILIFSDDIQQLSQHIGNDSLHFYPMSEQIRSTASIYEMNWRWSMVSDTIRLNDYNYRQPDVSLLLETSITSNHTADNSCNTGTRDYRYQDHYHTLTEGKFLLRVRQQALDCQRKIWQIKTDAVYLQPGYLLLIEHHPIKSMNGSFYVISVQHFANQAAMLPLIQASKSTGNFSSNGNSAYYNIAQLIPAHIPFRPLAPEPLFQENGIAKITGTPGNYAPIDEEGRYLIRPLYDASISADDCSSHRVRLVHPLNGLHYGMHFPLQCGTEVLLTHINGDPDRPVIIGVLPNLNSLPPVTAVNKSQHILKSKGNNQFVFDDLQQAEHILLETENHNNRVSLDATQEQQQILISSQRGTVHLQAGQIVSSHTQNNHMQIVGNEHSITVNNQQQIVSQQGDISFNAATDLILSANNAITLATRQQDIVMQADSDINIHAENNAHFTICHGDCVIQVSNGHLQLQANYGVSLASTGTTQQINFAQSGASIQITAQDIKICSPLMVHFEAKQINVSSNVTLLNYTADSSTMTTNLILHYHDEKGAIYSALNGIYQLLPES